MKRTKQQLGVMIGYRRAEIKKSNEYILQLKNIIRQKYEEIDKLTKEYEENDF